MVVREDVPGDKRLVAYVVAQPGPAARRRRAARASSSSSCPSTWCPRPSWRWRRCPLTPNGKVDRKALPAPEALAPRAGATSRPRTPTGGAAGRASGPRCCACERVGIHDNFFELGGHSLLATQVVSRIRAAFGVELPLRALFEAPTVAALAAAPRRALQAGAPLQAPAARARRRATGPLPLSFAQQRLWFLDQLEPGSSAYNMPAVAAPGGRAGRGRAASAPSPSWSAATRPCAPPSAPRPGSPSSVIAPAGVPAPARGGPARPARLRARGRGPAPGRARTRSGPSTWPRARCCAPRCCSSASGEHVLLLDHAPHRLRRLVHGRAGARAGRALRGLLPRASPRRCPSCPCSTRTTPSGSASGCRARCWSSSSPTGGSSSPGAPPRWSCPPTGPVPPSSPTAAPSLPVHLPQALSEALKALCQREGVTPFMALLAAFQVLLSPLLRPGRHLRRLAHRRPHATPSSRASSASSSTRSCCARASPATPPSAQLLAQVRETTLGAYAHQDVPFEKLVEELQPERDLSRSPLFQVMFALQNAPHAATASCPGLSLRAAGRRRARAAKFDLTLSLSESPRGLRRLAGVQHGPLRARHRRSHG